MKKVNFILILLTVVFSLIGVASAQPYNCPMGGMMSGFYGGYGFGWMIFSWLIGLLIIVALILLIIWLLKQINKEK